MYKIKWLYFKEYNFAKKVKFYGSEVVKDEKSPNLKRKKSFVWYNSGDVMTLFLNFQMCPPPPRNWPPAWPLTFSDNTFLHLLVEPSLFSVVKLPSFKEEFLVYWNTEYCWFVACVCVCRFKLMLVWIIRVCVCVVEDSCSPCFLLLVIFHDDLRTHALQVHSEYIYSACRTVLLPQSVNIKNLLLSIRQ